jgi:hypothetical protein
MLSAGSDHSPGLIRFVKASNAGRSRKGSGISMTLTLELTDEYILNTPNSQIQDVLALGLLTFRTSLKGATKIPISKKLVKRWPGQFVRALSQAPGALSSKWTGEGFKLSWWRTSPETPIMVGSAK